jgi:hypothetical protein
MGSKVFLTRQGGDDNRPEIKGNDAVFTGKGIKKCWKTEVEKMSPAIRGGCFGYGRRRIEISDRIEKSGCKNFGERRRGRPNDRRKRYSLHGE